MYIMEMAPSGHFMMIHQYSSRLFNNILSGHMIPVGIWKTVPAKAKVTT
jgi:hypothetical protein